MRVTDIQLAFPSILLAITLVTVLGPGVVNLIIVLGITGWIPTPALCGRGAGPQGARVRRRGPRPGGGDARIIFRHVLPNVADAGDRDGTFALANTIIVESSLSFLGLGVPPRMPTWGSMLSGGRTYLTSAWWIWPSPALAILSPSSRSTPSATGCETRSTPARNRGSGRYRGRSGARSI